MPELVPRKKGFGKHGLSPAPDKTIRVFFRASGHVLDLERAHCYTGQVKIKDGVLVVYDDLPDGDFFTIAGLPLCSLLAWEEVPPE
jgi:hypothetical protein